jgi:hypothetical protein
MPITIARELTASLSGGKKITRSFANASNYLWAAVMIRDSASTVSSFTYNGVDLSLVGGKVALGMACRIYHISSPFEGVADIECELSANTDWAIFVMSLDGVQLFTPIQGTSQTDGTGTAIALARGVQVGGLRVDIAALNANGVGDPLAIAGDGQIEKVNLEIGDLRALVSCSYNDPNGIIEWTLDNSTPWIMLASGIQGATVAAKSGVEVAVTATGVLTLVTRPNASVTVAVTATGATPTVALTRGSRDYAVFDTDQVEEVEFANG